MLINKLFNFSESVSLLPFFGFDVFTAQKASHRSCPSPSIVAVNHEVITVLDPKTQVCTLDLSLMFSSHDVLILKVFFNHTTTKQSLQNSCLTIPMDDVQSLRSIRSKKDKMPSVEITFGSQAQTTTISFGLKQVRM